MPFPDEIVAGDYLIRNAIKSTNYVTGVSGWAINADGTAEFNSLQINGGEILIVDPGTGNTVASINNLGTGSFTDLTVVNSPTIMGLDFETEWIDPLPQGIRALGHNTTLTRSGVTTEVGVLEVACTIPAGRCTEIRVSFWASANNTSPNDMAIRVRYTTNGTAPSTSSTVLFTEAHSNETQFLGESWFGSKTFNADELPPGDYRFLLTLARLVGAGQLSTSASADQIVEMVVEDKGASVPNTGVDTTGGGGGGAGGAFQNFYACTWSGSYNGSGNRVTGFSGGANAVYQGNIGDGNGNRTGLIGFDYSTIQSDLAGSTNLNSWVDLYAQHWYYNAGGTLVLGTHNQAVSSAPSTFGSNNTNRVQSPGFPKPGLRRVGMFNTIAENFRDNTAKGLCTGPGQGGDPLTYYGYLSGFGMSNPPVLIIYFET